MAAERKSLGTGRIRKKKNVESNVLDLGRARVREAFDLFDTIAVSFSGGKDSTAVLNLALEEAKRRGNRRIVVFFFDEEAIPIETIDYCRRVSRLPEVEFWWLCLPIKHRNACSRKQPFWHPWGPEDEHKWVRPLPPEAITHVKGFPTQPEQRPTMPEAVGLLFNPLDYGRVGMLMGIRSDESITRTRAILMRSQDTRPWIRPYMEGNVKHLFKVYPIYDWRTADVWTAPRELGWDYNTSYDNMDKAGIHPNQQRVAPPFGEEPLRGLWMYSVAFPDIWDRMSTRVPGAATAARYSRTSLYSHGKRPPKPDTLTWPEFVKLWVEKHPELYRGEIAARVQDWMHNHYGKTSEPLAADAPHPDTGVSWAMLLNIAIRGDFKNRRQAQYGQDYAKAKARYDADIAAMRERGDL